MLVKLELRPQSDGRKGCKRLSAVSANETSRSCGPKKRECGLHPAGIMYLRCGMEVASSAHSPLMACRSLSALWLWYEDPTASSLFAPILRWSKEVWLTGTHPRGETGEHGQFLNVFNLPALPRIWERGKLHRPERRRSVKGLVGATFLSLDRIKWTWLSPFQFFDDNNTEIMLTTTSPALLESMLKAAVRRTNLRQAAAKLADSSGFSRARASPEVARRVADSKRGRPKQIRECGASSRGDQGKCRPAVCNESHHR